MQARHPQRVYRPLTEAEIDDTAASLLAAVQGGALIAHFRLEPEESLEAIMARVRALAQARGVRIVVKREIVAGRLRYRLRLRHDGE